MTWTDRARQLVTSFTDERNEDNVQHDEHKCQRVHEWGEELTMQDHILETVYYSNVASSINSCQISSAKPAITGEGILAGLGQLPVALKHSGALALDLPNFT